MDVPEALADLMEISSQVEAAVVLDGSGEPIASTLGSEDQTRELARAASELLAAAGRVRSGEGPDVTQLDAATRNGSVFVVRDGDRSIAATTTPSPTVGLVFYDLKTCLRALDATEQEPVAAKPRARRKRAEDDGDAAA